MSVACGHPIAGNGLRLRLRDVFDVDGTQVLDGTVVFTLTDPGEDDVTVGDMIHEAESGVWAVDTVPPIVGRYEVHATMTLPLGAPFTKSLQFWVSAP
jgi:hypothetical protein